MKILISASMGPGTLEAKVEPLSKIEKISDIYFVRKIVGPDIKKVKYIILPGFCKFAVYHLIIAPIVLLMETIKRKPALLISYHIIPYAFFVGIVGYLTHTPFVISQTGLRIESQAKNNKLLKWLLYYLFNKSVQVNCPGSRSVEFWQSKYPVIRNKFKILHSTIDINHYTPGGKSNKEFDFIFLGMLGKIKNIDLILRAFHSLIVEGKFFKLPKMVVVGDGPERDNLESLVKELNIYELVFFTGFVNFPSIWLNKSKFLVMASKSEGLPTAMMQAMACEVIPITNLVGNISDLVKHKENGFVYDGNDPEGISQMMHTALRSNEFVLEKLRARCRYTVLEKYSHEYAMSQWNELINNL